MNLLIPFALATVTTINNKMKIGDIMPLITLTNQDTYHGKTIEEKKIKCFYEPTS